MRIDKVEAIPIAVPLHKVFSGSGYRVDSRATIITRIHTADGLVSEVYNGDNRTHGRTIARIVEDELAPLLIGEDEYQRLDVAALAEHIAQFTLRALGVAESGEPKA